MHCICIKNSLIGIFPCRNLLIFMPTKPNNNYYNHYSFTGLTIILSVRIGPGEKFLCSCPTGDGQVGQVNANFWRPNLV